MHLLSQKNIVLKDIEQYENLADYNFVHPKGNSLASNILETYFRSFMEINKIVKLFIVVTGINKNIRTGVRYICVHMEAREREKVSKHISLSSTSITPLTLLWTNVI